MAGHLLIADDVSMNRIILKSRLAEACYHVELATDAESLLQLARTRNPDLILLPSTLDRTDGLALCAKLREDATLARTPILLMSDDTSRAYRLRAIQANCDAVLERLPEMGILRARIRNLLRRRGAEAELAKATYGEQSLDGFEAQHGPVGPGKIALVAQTLAEGLIWRNALTAQMRDRIAVIDPQNAMRDLENGPSPDAVVIADDPNNPDNVVHMLSDLRSRAETQRTAVILVQQEKNVPRAITSLDLGVSDLVADKFDATEMAFLLRRELARKAQDDVRRAALADGLVMSMTDPLTGLFNRRKALTMMDQIAHNALQSQEQFAVLVLDLDRFKAVNDTHGHVAGDVVLAEVAARMQGCMRRGDFLARIGGEEFLAVIRGCELSSAQTAAERLRNAVADVPVLLPDSQTRVSITVSIGLVIAGAGGVAGSSAELIDLADRGLYAAKSEGRNQVTVYQSAA